jgi:hypothetical protein
MAWLDGLDPDDPNLPIERGEQLADLRRIGSAVLGIEAAERALRAAVHAAHDGGRSWGDVAMVLGVSRQAARQRFGVERSGEPLGRPRGTT